PRIYDFGSEPRSAENLPETTYSYDALNRRTEVIQAANVASAQLGHDSPVSRTQYDAAGRVVFTLEPMHDGTPPRSGAVSYAYDKLDHQVQTDEGSWDYSTGSFTALRRTTREFDVLGNVMRETTGQSPAGSPYQANASTSEARYDALGRKVSVREAEGTDS